MYGQGLVAILNAAMGWAVVLSRDVEVLVTNRLPDGCEEALDSACTPHRLYRAPDRDGLLDRVGPRIRAVAGGNVDGALMARLPALEIIAGFGVGYDSIDIELAKARGIRVSNTPDVLNDAVAELTMGLMIALARRIPEADRFVRGGRWPGGGFGLTAELTAATVGIVGLGRIGREVARRCDAMKMRVVYHGRRQQADVPYRYYANLVEMAGDCDWLVALVPGGEGTQGLISREVLEALGSKGRFVNLGRGSIVDEPALVHLLATGGLGGAALDVFENEPDIRHEFLAFDNVILSPHQGSATVTTREAMGALMLDNLKAHFAGQPLLTAVV